MTVKELIERLKDMPQDSEVHYPDPESFNPSTEIHDMYESTVQYGIALRNVPPPTNVVVLCSGMEGL